ncbi:MAG: hypothetical protein V4457_12420 [Pseudomonadota bacterium]
MSRDGSGFTGVMLMGVLWLILASIVPAYGEELSAERTRHLMIIKGAQLPTLLGAPLDDYHLESVQQAGLEPIAFQFDEFDQQGNPYFAKSGTPIDGKQGVLDGSDELVFMYRDAGPKRNAQINPRQGNVALELQLWDGQEARYVYLVKGGSAQSDKHYVRYDSAKTRVETDDYVLQFADNNLLHWQAHYYKHYQDPSKNLIKGLDLNIHFTVFTPWTQATLTQEQLKPQIIGIKEGPVRAIVEMDTMVKLAGVSFPFAKLRMSYVFSQGEVASISWGQIPYVGLLMKAVYGFDFIDAINFNDLRGSKVMSGKGPREAGVVDGEVAGVEKQLAIGGIVGDVKHPETLHLEDNYLCLDTGKGYVHLAMQEFYPEALSGKERKALEDNLTLFTSALGVQYLDDLTHGPELGYRMGLNAKDIHLDLSGSMEMRFGVRRFFLPTLDAGGPAQFEREFRHPPVLRVSAI